MKRFLSVLLSVSLLLTCIDISSGAVGAQEAKNPALDQLQGSWKMAYYELDGKKFGPFARLRITGNQYSFVGPGTDTGTFTLSRTGRLNRCTFRSQGRKGTMKAIYQRNGDQLRVAYLLDFSKRPKSFSGMLDSGEGLVVYTFVWESALERIFREIGDVVEEKLLAMGDALEELLVGKDKDKYLIGQIFVTGNRKIPDRVILEQVPLYPGQPLRFWRIHLAEFRLTWLGHFAVEPAKANRPRVKVDIPTDTDHRFLDIRIEVVEKSRP